MKIEKTGSRSLRVNLLSLAVLSCFANTNVHGNPTGATVVSGVAVFQQTGNLLQVTNSPNAIINWQSFSIGASEITRFLQQSASSAVLNRVISQNPSSILGALQSNGRVFLVNPNGILFGTGAQVDVAGLVASTLNLSNADFLAGRLRFTDVPGAGSIVNQGTINTAPGGNVYLLGPAVTNSGIITSPKGEVVLAAGNSVELVNPGTPGLRVEITAPDNQAVNLGQIVADSGRVGIYAGLINQAGTIRADSAVSEGGKILLKATKSTTLESTSVLSAQGQGGGEIKVLADERVNVAGLLDASAPNGGNGGFIDTSGGSVKVADGTVVTTSAPFGNSGMWLIDPPSYIIGAAGCTVPTVCDISGTTLGSNLGTTNVTITSDQGTDFLGGNVEVNGGVSWNNGGSLMLLARGQVFVNSPITHTGSGGNISLYAGWDGGSTTLPVVSTSNFGRINLGAAVSTTGNMALIAGQGIGGSGVSSAVGVTANQLLANGGAGGVFLGDPNVDTTTINMVNTLAGRAAICGGESCGGFMFQNGKSLDVGEVTSPAGNLSLIGIGTNNGIIGVNVTGAGSNLTVSRRISSNMNSNPPGFGAAVTLRATGNIDVNAAVSATTLTSPTSGGGGRSNVFLTSDTGNIHISGTGGVTVQGATSTTNTVTHGPFGGDIYADGGPAQIFITANAGSITVDGGATITATAGNGSSTSGGISSTSPTGTVSASGGGADIELQAGNGITLNRAITATAGGGGIASGNGTTTCNGFTLSTICAGGGSAGINLSGGSGAVTVNGNVAAIGRNGGTASFSGPPNPGAGHTADGGSAQVVLTTTGSITVGATSNITLTGGNGGPGVSWRNGGEALVFLGSGTGTEVANVFTFTPTGTVNVSGHLTATGGAGVSGPQAKGGSAWVVVAGLNVNLLSGSTNRATGGHGGASGGTGGNALVALAAGIGFTVDGDNEFTLGTGSTGTLNVTSASVTANSGGASLTTNFGEALVGMAGAAGITVTNSTIEASGPGGNVNLLATATGGQITQGASSVILADKLTAIADSGITLSGTGNAVSNFAAKNNSTGAISITNTTPLSIFNNAAASVAGLINTSRNVTLNNNGAVTQTAPISASGLELIGGPYTLNNGGNSISTIAANTSGNNLSFKNNRTLAVGMVGATTGISAGSGSVTLTTTAGDINGSGGPTISSFNSGTGITLDAAGGIGIGAPVNTNVTGGGMLSLTTHGAGAAGNITLIEAGPLGDNLNFAFNGTGHTTTLTSTSGPITIAGGDPCPPSICFDNSFTLITSAGDIQWQNTAPFAFGSGTLRLVSAGKITQSAGAAPLSGTALGVRAADTVDLSQASNDFGTIAANVTGANSSFSYKDASGVSIGTVSAATRFAATSGITTNNGNVTLNAGGTVAVTQNIAAGTGAVNITTTGPTSNIDGGGGTISTTNAATGLTLSAGGGIGIGAPLKTDLGGAGKLNVTTNGSGVAGDVKIVEAGALNTSQITTLNTAGTGTQTVSLTNSSGDFTFDTTSPFGNINDNLIITATSGNILRTALQQMFANDLTLHTPAGGIGQTSAGSTFGVFFDVAGHFTARTGAAGAAGDISIGNFAASGFKTSNLTLITEGAGPHSIGLGYGSVAGFIVDAPLHRPGDSLRINPSLGNPPGSVTLSKDVTVANLRINAVNAITQTAGNLTVTGNLGLRANNDIQINAAGSSNHVSGVLAAVVANPGKVFAYRDNGAVTVGTVTGGGAFGPTVDGISTNNGNITLNAGGTVAVTKNIAAGTGAVNITTSAGNINGGGGTISSSNAVTGITLNAGGGIGVGAPVNTNVIGGGLLNLTTNGVGTAGNITLIEAGPLGDNLNFAFNGAGHTTTLTSTSGPITIAGGDPCPPSVCLNNSFTLITSAGDIQWQNTAWFAFGTGALQLISAGDINLQGASISAGTLSLNGQNVNVSANATPTVLTANGALTVNAAASFSLAGGNAQNAVAEMRGGPVNITVSDELTLTGGSGKDAYALLFSNGNFDLTIGRAIRLDAGTGKDAWAKMQTSSKNGLFNINFTDILSGGYFINGVEGKLSQGSTGFFNENKPAKPGKTFFTTYP